MTKAQVVEMSVTVNNNSPIQDCVHPDDRTQPTFEMTPGLKPFKKRVRQGNKSTQISLVRIVKIKEISSTLLKNC